MNQSLCKTIIVYKVLISNLLNKNSFVFTRGNIIIIIFARTNHESKNVFLIMNNKRIGSQTVFVERENDVINIYNLNRAQAVSQFINAINSGIRAGYDNFLIDVSSIEGVFPNTVVPIAALIDSYEEDKIIFEWQDSDNLAIHTI